MVLSHTCEATPDIRLDRIIKTLQLHGYIDGEPNWTQPFLSLTFQLIGATEHLRIFVPPQLHFLFTLASRRKLSKCGTRIGDSRPTRGLNVKLQIEWLSYDPHFDMDKVEGKFMD